jgi:hypothetical protein
MPTQRKEVTLPKEHGSPEGKISGSIARSIAWCLLAAVVIKAILTLLMGLTFAAELVIPHLVVAGLVTLFLVWSYGKSLFRNNP